LIGLKFIGKDGYNGTALNFKVAFSRKLTHFAFILFLMAGFFIGLISVFLFLVSLFIVFIVLMQRSGGDSGMGSAMGGGSVESALGPSSGNVLTRATVYATVVFFVLAFVLYLVQLARSNPSVPHLNQLPTISLTEAPENVEAVIIDEVVETQP